MGHRPPMYSDLETRGASEAECKNGSTHYNNNSTTTLLLLLLQKGKEQVSVRGFRLLSS